MISDRNKSFDYTLRTTSWKPSNTFGAAATIPECLVRSNAFGSMESMIPPASRMIVVAAA